MLNKSRKLVLRTFYHLYVMHVVLCTSADVILTFKALDFQNYFMKVAGDRHWQPSRPH